MKSILFAIVLLSQSFAFAVPETPFTLEGKTSIGEPCFLVVEQWYFEPSNVQTWQNLRLSVRTNWQSTFNPPVEVKQSPTPWALYGINKETYDQYAVQFGVNELEPAGIENFLFQTYSETEGTIQQYCRFN